MGGYQHDPQTFVTAIQPQELNAADRVRSAIAALIGPDAARSILNRPGGVVVADSAALMGGGGTGRAQTWEVLLPSLDELESWRGATRTHSAEPRTAASASALFSRLSTAQAQAFHLTHGDTIVLIADRIAPGREAAVFLHEIMHKHGRRTLGTAQLERLVGGVQRWATAAPASVERRIYEMAITRERAAATGHEEGREELLAYAVEEAMLLGVRPSLEGREGSAEQWLGDVVATLRGAVFQITNGAAPPLDAQQIVDLAYALAQLECPTRSRQIYAALGIQPESNCADDTSVRFSFAGVRASTADLDALIRAHAAIAKGLPADYVRQETGWFEGVDKAWRFEISDFGAITKGTESLGDVIMHWYRVRAKETGDQAYPTEVSDLLWHPRLFAAYPDVGKMEVRMMPAGRHVEGSLACPQDGSPPYVELDERLPSGRWRSIMMHEIQHRIQMIEGFASGGAWHSQAPGESGTSAPDHVDAARQNSQREAYRRLAGEVEARNVQARLAMTDERRRETNPLKTQDVASQDQLVRFDAAKARAPLLIGDEDRAWSRPRY